MQSFDMLCRMNFLCAVVREPTHLFISVVNVFLFVFNPYSTVPDFIVSKQSVRITVLFVFTTFLWPIASAFLLYTSGCLLRYNFSFHQGRI